MGIVKTKLAHRAGLVLGLGALIFTGLNTSNMVKASIIDRPFLRASSVVIVFGASDFAENGGVGPVVSDFYLLDNVPSGQAAPDLIAADGVTTIFNTPNTYTPTSDGAGNDSNLLNIEGALSGGVLTNVADFNILDANDSISQFGLGTATDIDLQTFFKVTRFFVASNAVFDIYAHATSLDVSGDFTSMDLSDISYFLFIQTALGGVNGWGSSAQNPGFSNPAVQDLNDISAGPTQVFNGVRRTARVSGSITQQAVSFVPIYFLPIVETGNRYDLSQGTGSIGATITYTVYTP